MTPDARVTRWFDSLRERHTQELRFAEIRKGVVALSRIYVEERSRIKTRVFDGAGKRAGFACFYTPIHFLLVRRILDAIDGFDDGAGQVIDLGCGLLAAGASWAYSANGDPRRVIGLERNAWAASEARLTLKALDLGGRVHHKSLEHARAPSAGDAVVAAYTVNELDDDGRRQLLSTLTTAAKNGTSVLIVEPLARRSLRWWPEWEDSFSALGGRADEWRFPVTLPPFVAELDRASGLDHSKLSGRSLYVKGSI